MTRLEAWAERVTREMLYLWRVEDTKGDPGCNLRGQAAARAVLEREVRELFTLAGQWTAASHLPTFLDAPEPPPRPLAGNTARRL